MGVRGLTTFIAKNQEKYLKRYRLHDTTLVIDGNSLCAQLYSHNAKCNDIFGGDYDKFAKCIEKLFDMFTQCNIKSIVIFDGGYEKKKLRTVYDRLKHKLRAVQNAHPMSRSTMFPLFIRDLFKDVLLRLKITVVRCNYEADFDIACVAKKLNCPVLSYDSDFYVFDVLYIPFTTMDFHTSKFKENDQVKQCICCQIYIIDNFVNQFGGLSRENLPLMATLLGNDYVKKSYFSKFYAHLKLSKRRSQETSDQQRTIRAVIEWLRNETFDSAVQKILGRMKKKKRYFVAQKIKRFVECYLCTNSHLFEYLGIDCENKEMQIDICTEVASDESNDESNDSESDENSTNSEPDKETEKEIVCLELAKENFFFHNYKWFEMMCRRGDFPTMFTDILTHKTCIYIPQIESSSNMNTILISLPILQAICKILDDKLEHLKYLAKNHRCKIKVWRYPLSDLNLPKLIEIEHLKFDKCEKIFLKVLNVNDKVYAFIKILPNEWKLYFLSIIYWATNATSPKVTSCHIYAIVLCLLNLSVVDKKTGYYRSKQMFTKKYEKKLKNLSVASKSNELTIYSDNKTIMYFLTNITKDEALFFINSFVSNFEMNEKLLINKKQFDIDIVDAFAQFQSCLLFVKYLNALLKYPIPSFEISQFFNGTFLYNCFANLEKRSDVETYIKTLLNNTPLICYCFTYIVDAIKNLVNIENVTCEGKRRRRRRKKNKTKDERTELSSKEEDESDELFDENNKFSVLSISK